MKLTHNCIYCLITLLVFAQYAAAQTSIDTTPNKAQVVNFYTTNGIYYNGNLYGYGREIKSLFATQGNEAATQYYQQFQRNHTWGLITSYLGFGITIYSVLNLITGEIPRGVSAGTLVGGIGIWIAGGALNNKSEKKYQKAVSEFNAVQQKRQSTSLHIGTQPHGLGVAVRF